MSTLPRCSTKNTIVEATLADRAARGELIKIVVTYRHDLRSAYVAGYFTDEPVRPMYIATHRDRYAPKMSLDLEKVLVRLLEDFPVTRVEVNVERWERSVVHYVAQSNDTLAAHVYG